MQSFKNYYTSENRRYFSTSSTLVRDYHIYIPPGEWDFGYYVDACWAPPSKAPVTKVPDDFPLWANSMANYRLDAEVVGEIDGDNPAKLFVDVYNHSGNDIPADVWVYNGDMFPFGFLWTVWTGDEPINMGDHVRWVIDVPNIKKVEPGWYWLAVMSSINNNIGKLPVLPEGIESNPGAGVWQIVKVHVVS
jgi:hypothetical protein